MRLFNRLFGKKASTPSTSTPTTPSSSTRPTRLSNRFFGKPSPSKSKSPTPTSTTPSSTPPRTKPINNVVLAYTNSKEFEDGDCDRSVLTESVCGYKNSKPRTRFSEAMDAKLTLTYDIWKESYHSGKSRYYFRNMNTNKCKWDEPPSGAVHVWYMDTDFFEVEEGTSLSRLELPHEAQNHADLFIDAHNEINVLHNTLSQRRSDSADVDDNLINMTFTCQTSFSVEKDVEELTEGDVEEPPSERISGLTIESENPPMSISDFDFEEEEELKENTKTGELYDDEGGKVTAEDEQEEYKVPSTIKRLYDDEGNIVVVTEPKLSTDSF